MDNRVYYGQYSLKHWINLILTGNIQLPNYQRLFVWKEEDVVKLINTFKNRQFVPPVTIGAFGLDVNTNHNLILDGQQRLTSILLAYIGLFPDKVSFAAVEIQRLADDNDSGTTEADGQPFDDILEWTFQKLTVKGNSKEEILLNVVPNNYKSINLNIDEKFWGSTFLGFSFLVPQAANKKDQQKFYSSVFRNINALGQTLLDQESRKSLYFLDENLEAFFDPPFIRQFTVGNSNTDPKADFVRYLAILSQYAEDGDTNILARGFFKSKMEKYYEEYIYSIVGEVDSTRFKRFDIIFPNGDFHSRFQLLEEMINSLDIPKHYTSIIDMDMYLIGLIYTIIFDNQMINHIHKEQLHQSLNAKIAEYKTIEAHKRSPGALKYLKDRINASIEIYNNYIDA